MKKYKIYHSQRFDKELEKFSKSFQDGVDNIEDQLVENPYVGRPLNVRWFREKRYEKWRIYYTVYDDLEAVFMVAISDKKDQQKVINTIRLMFDFFRKELEELISKEDLT
ncbi:MAG: type II toxin-antitoxin system RelE/ParE family toxin [Candidatus Nanoarchaeia archaeon]